MRIPETGVSFRCEKPELQKLYDEAERKCLGNLRSFGGRPVLVEGGGYDKIWLETQPMGGEMYALRHPEAALNNILLFMENQREDGRLPGSVRCTDGRIVPEFNKYQGFCFTEPAMNLYYLFGEDPEFLEALKQTLIRQENCLRRTRSLGRADGLLRSFCVYDTGEDRAVRYGDAPCWWTEDRPPEGFERVPMASMDVTSWSYACRSTLARICRIQGDETGEQWDRLAGETADCLRASLWDEKRGALFDRGPDGKTIDILSHNTLRCMYWGSVSGNMADRFVKEHLLNPAEFWTPLPLPSTAANDPAFVNAPENNWSGQPEGLTWQRAVQALENYGYERVVTALGQKLFDAVIRSGYRFTQQYDPFTGRASLVHARTHEPAAPGDPVQDAYGPTLLAVLEYFSHRWGIRNRLDQVWLSAAGGQAFETAARFFGREYSLVSDGEKCAMRVDGKEIWQGCTGSRIITKADGSLLAVRPLE